jgi:hypothetical protein
MLRDLLSSLSDYEWFGVAYFNGINITGKKEFLYEGFLKHLPLSSYEFDGCEIDTPSDLNYAIKFINNEK